MSEVLDKKIENEISKANITDAAIKKSVTHLKSLSLSIDAPRSEYMEIVEEHKAAKKFQSLITDTCKKGREDAVSEQKKWVAKEKELKESFEPGLSHVAKLRCDWEKADNKKKEDEKRRQETNLFNRQLTLTKMGAVLDDGFMVLEDAIVDVLVLKEVDDQIWNEDILPDFKSIFDKHEKARVEQEEADRKARQEEQDRLDKIEAENKILRDQKTEFEKKQKEIEDNRIKKISQLGINFIHAHDAFVLDDIYIPMMDIRTYSEDKFEKLLSDVQKRKEEISKKQEDDEKRWRTRLSQFEDTIWNGVEVVCKRKKETVATCDNLVNWSKEEFIKRRDAHNLWVKAEFIKEEKERKDKIEFDKKEAARLALEEKELNDKLEEERKQEEISKMSDSKKWVAFCEQLNDIQFPVFKSIKYKKLSELAQAKINEIKSLY